ncbi:MAG: helix-turn-helix transcriptional regulator [Acidobacteria bacterium]|nr:helix-turn-helix transcriptional regulator [Acidobacteriota bacterium]MBV9070060.1 helix-turn-helix transcriptional regulator [Acidobacteriota bacterium]MBV9184865.1 helix-turn-helix transcriptional regulator [Acidobacteriota bacterium]
MTRDEALKTLGSRIAELRREKGLTQEALAEAMGVSRNHVADIELGTRNTGVWSLLLVCQGLAVTPGALFEDFTAHALRRLGR